MKEKAKTLNESEFNFKLAKRTGLPQKTVHEIMKAQTDLICEMLETETPVRTGLGEISVLTYEGRGGFSFKQRNIMDERLIHARVKFKPSAILKRTINNIKTNKQ
ncbi:MAG: HU family DNA-binding protein [Prevotella sp.]|nr:HU family DNA-binding protein [Prevotella sp.]